MLPIIACRGIFQHVGIDFSPRTLMDYYEAFNLMYQKKTPLFGGSQRSDNHFFFTNLPSNLLTFFLSAKEKFIKLNSVLRSIDITISFSVMFDKSQVEMS